jgi:DNA-binding beta-propeller fold protein YncE
VFSGRTEPTAEPAEVFGNGPTGLRQWNVRTGVVLDFPDTMHIGTVTRGVGPGLVRGHVALFARSQWRLWRITGPKATLLDTIPLEVASDRFVAVLAFGRYVTSGSHQFLLKACDLGACASQAVTGESGFDIVRSRRGDRAALVAPVVSDSGAPVVDIASGRILYFVPPFRSVSGAAFSEEGDTLYVAGQEHAAAWGDPSLLAAVGASDGTSLAIVPLEYSPCAVATEPTGSWLYVAGLERAALGGFSSVLQVFERRTLASITTLRLGRQSYGQGFCRILPSSLEQRVYVIETAVAPFDSLARASLTRFDTP